MDLNNHKRRSELVIETLSTVERRLSVDIALVSKAKGFVCLVFLNIESYAKCLEATIENGLIACRERC